MGRGVEIVVISPVGTFWTHVHLGGQGDGRDGILPGVCFQLQVEKDPQDPLDVLGELF